MQFFFRLITSVLLLAWGQFFCPQNLANSFESFKRKQSIHLFFLPLLSGHWRTHSDLGYVVFLKPQTCLALLSQTLITDSHNSQPVDSHQQTPLGVTYTPFLPLPLYSSTASGLRQIDRRGSDSRETREEERGLMGMDKVRKEDAENIFSQHQKHQTPDVLILFMEILRMCVLHQYAAKTGECVMRDNKWSHL